MEVVRWNTDEKRDNPGPAIGRLVAFVLTLFVVGLIFPEVDNWSHLFGFFFGCFLAVGLRPFKMNRGQEYTKGCRIGCALVCILLTLGLLLMLILLFYFNPITECEGCVYFNCIPFTETYCEGLSVKLERNLTGVEVPVTF